MKKTFIFIVLVLMGVSGFVYAQNEISEAEVLIGEGWNLVYSFASPERVLSGGDISSENIKAVYLLLPTSQEYVRIYPNPENDKLVGIDDDYYSQHAAMWVFSDKSGTMRYRVEPPLPLNERNLFTGWNFVGLTAEMGFGDPSMAINHFSGTCNIEKAFFFNSVEWYQLDLEEDDIADDAPYLGIAVKVTNDCNLGTPTGNTDGPPGLPGGDSNTCTDSDGTIETNTFNEGQTLEAEGLLVTLLEIDASDSVDIIVVDMNDPNGEVISIGSSGDALFNGINYSIQLISATVGGNAVISVSSQKDYFESGTMVFSNNDDFSLTTSDECALVSSYDSDGTPGGWQSIGSCSGADCYVQEAFCKVDSNGNFIDADATELYKCSNGCTEGACIN